MRAMTPTPDTTTPRPGILELLGYADLEDRVLTLEADLTAARTIISVQLAHAHEAHRREHRMRETIARQREIIRRLHTAERTRAPERRAA